jgi:hypothetical protein
MIKKFKTFINESVNIKKTEYQILHLNKEERIEYFIQRINEFNKKSRSFEDYEWELCPPKLKLKYVELCIIAGEGLEKNMIEDIQNEELKLKYKISIKPSIIETEEDFNKLSDSVKEVLISSKRKIVDLLTDYELKTHKLAITDYEFDWCNEFLKHLIISKCISKGSGLTKKQFDFCSDEQKNKYIYGIIKNNNELEDYEWEFCSDKQKTDYIKNIFKSEYNIYLQLYQFKWCNDELKKNYILHCIKKRNDLSEDKFDLLSDELKKYYININIDLNKYFKIPFEIFIKLNDELKKYYYENQLESNNSKISNSEFNLLSDSLKTDYIKKCLAKDIKLSPIQEEYKIKNNL